MSPPAATPAPQPWWRTTLKLSADVFLPMIVYYVLRLLGATPLLALVLTGIPMLVVAVVLWIRTRTVNDLALFVLITFSATSAVGLISASARLTMALQQGVGVLVGLGLLATTFSRRPMTYTMTLRTLEMFPPVARRFKRDRWEELWPDHPRFRRAWRGTNVWLGLSQLLDAAIRVVMAYTLPVDLVPVLGTLVGVVTAVAIFGVFVLAFQIEGVWALLRTLPPQTAPTPEPATVAPGAPG